LTELSQNLSETEAPAAAASPIRVILVISSRLERLGWSIVVDNQADMELSGQFDSVGKALAFLAAHPVDVALIDEAMLTPKHCEALRKHASQHASRFLLVSQHPVDESLESSRYSFASACLLKGIPAGTLLAAVRGGPPTRG
jgi:DNA-binding NarL/FixJ family response regulator